MSEQFENQAANVRNTAEPRNGDRAAANMDEIDYLDVRARSLDPETLDRALQQLETLPLDEVPAPASLPPGSIMPMSHNPLFIGRENELKTLAKSLKAKQDETPGATVAVTGIGGVGKSQLVSEFVHRYGQYFSGGVFWLNFGDAAAVLDQIAACGGVGGMDLRQDFYNLTLEEQLQEVMSAWLSSLPRLLVFDNCEQEELLHQWRPPFGGCRVVLTSRRSQWDTHLGVTTLLLDTLSRNEGVALLRSYRTDFPQDDSDLDAISEGLGDLPLALNLAGAYLASHSEVTPADYQRQLRESDSLQSSTLRAASAFSPSSRERDVARTFALSYDQLDTTDPTDALATQLLARASGFAPGELVPLDLLRSTLDLSGDDPVAAQQMKGALDRLSNLGLLQTEDGALRMHRLVATFMRGVVADTDAGGPSTHIATDIWTLDDSLGYKAYAYAIYRFMTHPQTEPPLTISIQAPWGGGKTSLMRMIQSLLDPGALRELKQEASKPRGEITVKQVLSEAENWIRKAEESLPMVQKAQGRELLTVWFNAWKYENTKEVWAGLADAIMQQIAARLPLKTRELFWLRLNLRRVDAERIRRRIYDRISLYWWRKVRAWAAILAGILIVSTIVLLIAWITDRQIMQVVGLSGMGLSTIATTIVAITKFIDAKKSVEQEPAAVSLSDYLDIPNYDLELEFVHHVEADLRRVFSSVPSQYLPIVIFIDDLDRCSPEKVAQVVEGVNLFLGGDFASCMFVIGMDAEMVAAALQAAHKDMIACLPKDAGIPVGWRFMDKFVQLPFLIPPTQEERFTRYTSALFSTGQNRLDEPETEQLAGQALGRITSVAAVGLEIERLQAEHDLDEDQVAHLRDRMEAELVQQRLEEGIQRFSDKNPEIRRVIGTAIPYFRGNPRELKRFINAFRFHYFLWWAHRAQELPGPTLDQMLRWTVLSMRWPEVVRWLRRGGGNDWVATADRTASKEKTPATA
jgi:hypothetical protein